MPKGASLIHKPLGQFRSSITTVEIKDYEFQQTVILKPTSPDVPVTHRAENLRQDGPVNHLPNEFYSPFLSQLAKSRKPSPSAFYIRDIYFPSPTSAAVRGLFPLEYRPGVISLLAGKPNPTTFPITSLQFTTRNPDHTGPDITLRLSDNALAEGLQYGSTAGMSCLLEWLAGLQNVSHGRKIDEGWRLSIGTGSQDVLYKACMSLVDKGDSVLIESPAYAGVLPMLQTLGCNLVEVETDNQGISSASLRAILQNWPKDIPRPRVLYTVPTGCNPTGMTTATDRRREIIQLAREYNFLILEDDPYYYLSFQHDTPCPPSYFHLDANSTNEPAGRVVRFDSLSKVLSAGMRLGFVSGPKPILDAIDLESATANMQASSLTQAIAHSLLSAWGYHGFREHCKSVSAFYRARRDIFENAMQRYLSGLAEWTTPESGMFYWFKLLLPSTADGSEGDSKTLIETKALERGVLALPGTVFLPNGRKSAYVRASFSLLSEQQVEEALRRLREVILDVRGVDENTGAVNPQ